MTKRHFIALANVIIASKPRAFLPYSDPYEQWAMMRDKIADFCASQNPRFNRARWLAYVNGECGPNGGKTGRTR